MEYIGIILFWSICFLIFLLFRKMNLGVTDSYIYTFTLCSGGVYFLSNVLSPINAFNGRALCGTYFGCLLLILIMMRRCVHANRLDGNSGIIRWKEMDIMTKLIVFIIFFSVFFSVVRAVVYPPMNNDSVVYHLPRAVYYYEMEAVSNVPSTYVIMNYSGPANAILLAHWFILSGGNELGVNLIQFPAMICVGCVIYRICSLLDIDFRYSVLAGGLAMSLPLTILQAATTQNDLLAASYALLVVYFFVKTLKSSSRIDMICMGIAGGAVFISKIASASVVLPFFLAYFSYGGYRIFHEKKAKSLLFGYGWAFVSMLGITFSFWIRNFLDLNGDFLALGPSSYMNGAETFSFMDYVGKIWIYLIYSCCTRYSRISNVVLSKAREIYNFIGAKEYGNWDYYRIVDRPNHDFYPYGVTLIACLLCLFYLSIKGKSYFRIYAVLSVISLLLGYIIMPGNGFIQSVTRYTLGNVIVCVPTIAMVFNEFGNHGSKVKNASVCVVSWMFVFLMLYNVVVCNYLDTASPIEHAFDSSYEEKRDLLEPRYKSWININDDVKKVIDQNGCKNIGICEVKLSHIYTFMQKYMGEDYDIRSIYGTYGETYLDDTFVPDVIVVVDESIEHDSTYQYKNVEYILDYSSGAVLDNDAEAFVYIRR